MTSPGPSLHQAGRGAWMIPLLGRLALQLIEHQFAMLLEYAQDCLRTDGVWSPPAPRGDRCLVHAYDVALTSDALLQFGDMPVGLGQMLAFLSTVHGFAARVPEFADGEESLP